jgi:metal-sulfur cluster biosynthetic enzyme
MKALRTTRGGTLNLAGFHLQKYRNQPLVILKTTIYTFNRRVLYIVSLCIFSTEKEVLLPESEDRRVTSEQVLEVLQTCYDPCCKERSVSVVELGLIQGVKVAENGHDVQIELLLTSGWCPFSTHLLQMIDQNVSAMEGVGEVDTEIVWNTVWTPERMSASAKEKLTLPMAQLLPLRQRRLEREAQAAQQAI